ncbi:MAG TPA: PH domain-containing protein [Candidatus Avamphibacillus sp.]|nr:PH domain-containing protein [Candidatus Avamphibacillus sp.]
MRLPPRNRIALDAIKAWKITAAINVIILWLLTIAGFIFSNIFQFSYWFAGIALLISALSTYLFIFLFPKIRWRRWRYEVFEQEVYIQHGVLIVSQTLVPMVRVQHVDTKQGPILKKFNLASVTISTAATTHEIPALLEEDASDLRDRISALARVEDADV